MALTLREQKTIIADVSYRDWRIGLYNRTSSGHGGIAVRYLQVEFDDTDNYNPGEAYASKGRKWLISPHMTKSELVLTAWKAILTAIEHEAREQFTYRGRTIFGPHMDVDMLWANAYTTDVR